MNFIRYDPDTGTIVSIGFMDINHIQSNIDAGEPMLYLDKDINDTDWRVNLQTKQIEPITQSTLDTSETSDNNNGATSS